MDRLRIEQVDDPPKAFEILERTKRWLVESGHRQRISQTSYDTYLSWQDQNANYWIIGDDLPMGVFSLPLDVCVHWSSRLPDEPVYWLRALATDPIHRGKGIGTFALKQIPDLCNATVYLDCVSGFLPGYYERHGFQWLEKQHIEGFEVNLLRKHFA